MHLKRLHTILSFIQHTQNDKTRAEGMGCEHKEAAPGGSVVTDQFCTVTAVVVKYIDGTELHRTTHTHRSVDDICTWAVFQLTVLTLSCSVMSDSLQPTGLFVAHQAPLSMGFSMQEYWSGCHFLLQGILPTQGLNTSLLCPLHYRWILYLLSHQGNSVISNVNIWLTLHMGNSS